MYMYEPPSKSTFNSVEGDYQLQRNAAPSVRPSALLPQTCYTTLQVRICLFANHCGVCVRSVEFQEAFNLFDNRGDGKIQLNQVSCGSIAKDDR